MSVNDRLQSVFQEVFEKPQLKLTPGMNSENTEGWDSYLHINLVVAIEEKFSVQFSTKEIGKLTSVQDIVTALEGKGVS